MVKGLYMHEDIGALKLARNAVLCQGPADFHDATTSTRNRDPPEIGVRGEHSETRRHTFCLQGRCQQDESLPASKVKSSDVREVQDFPCRGRRGRKLTFHWIDEDLAGDPKPCRIVSAHLRTDAHRERRLTQRSADGSQEPPAREPTQFSGGVQSGEPVVHEVRHERDPGTVRDASGNSGNTNTAEYGVHDFRHEVRYEPVHTYGRKDRTQVRQRSKEA